MQKQRSGTVYEELARKKMEYIDFQMNLLKDEAERKEKRLAEKHDLEIKILKAELKNKENCLYVLFIIDTYLFLSMYYLQQICKMIINKYCSHSVVFT